MDKEDVIVGVPDEEITIDMEADNDSADDNTGDEGGSGDGDGAGNKPDGDEDGGSGKPDGDKGGDEGDEGDTSDKDDEEKPKDDKPAPSQPPAELKKVEDPGDFQPSDYSFEITYLEDDKPKTVKISSPDDIDSLPDNPQWASAKDFVKFQANYTKMVTGIEADRQKYEAKKSEYDKDTQAREAEQQVLANWESEIAYLRNEGQIPAIKPELENADWSDPKFANEPGIKEIVEIFEEMGKENERRARAGLPATRSILDTVERMNRQRQVSKEESDKQKQAEIRKQKGAKVAGNSNTQRSTVPKDMIVGEPGTLYDLTNDLF
jgi:hypothetical protein